MEELDDNELRAPVERAALLTGCWAPDDLSGTRGAGGGDGKAGGSRSGGGSSVCICDACRSSAGVGIEPKST